MIIDVKERWKKAAEIIYTNEEILLGSPTSFSLINDPKHISFVLSRYKFVSKMLQGKKTVLELGSGDGIGLPLIAKEVEKVYSIDWEKTPLESIQRRILKYYNNIELLCLDPAKENINLKVDAIFNIDFIEHIEPSSEEFLMKNIANCLDFNGVLITGTPNITASAYASECSQIHHVNLKSHETLKALMQKYFLNVFMFGMNDEVLHTGFPQMCHYIWSIAVGPRK